MQSKIWRFLANSINPEHYWHQWMFLIECLTKPSPRYWWRASASFPYLVLHSLDDVFHSSSRISDVIRKWRIVTASNITSCSRRFDTCNVCLLYIAAVEHQVLTRVIVLMRLTVSCKSLAVYVFIVIADTLLGIEYRCYWSANIIRSPI